jgi:hypothetical protein
MIVFLSLCSEISAQNQVYKLHSVVGDTIDKVEIDKYFLFDNQVTDSIDYLVLFQNKNLFNLVGFSDAKMKFDINISKDEVVLQKKKVEKLNKYFLSTLKKDSVKLDENEFRKLLKDSLNVNFKIMTLDLVKSMKKNNQRKFWEEHRKELHKSHKQGFIL